MHISEQQLQPQTTIKFGAHEFLGMTEALSAKSSAIDTLSALSRQVKDTQLGDMLQHHARAILDHYNSGVNLLKGQVGATGSWMLPNQITAEPLIGLSNPTYPAPNLNTQYMSDNVVAATTLQLYKYHAIAWLQIALECSNPQFRSYLMEGTLLSDRQAYDMFMYMNQRGYYQVPQVPEQLVRTMSNAYTTTPYTGYSPTPESTTRQQ